MEISDLITYRQARRKQRKNHEKQRPPHFKQTNEQSGWNGSNSHKQCLMTFNVTTNRQDFGSEEGWSKVSTWSSPIIPSLQILTHTYTYIHKKWEPWIFLIMWQDGPTRMLQPDNLVSNSKLDMLELAIVRSKIHQCMDLYRDLLGNHHASSMLLPQIEVSESIFTTVCKIQKAIFILVFFIYWWHHGSCETCKSDSVPDSVVRQKESTPPCHHKYSNGLAALNNFATLTTWIHTYESNIACPRDKS